jgi:MGT family glycosyltransferase
VYLLPAPGIPPIGLGLAPARGRLGRFRDRAIAAMTVRQWDKGVPEINELRTSLGLAPLDGFFDQLHRARRQLVLTSAEFDFPGTVAANARYVGAVLDDPAWAGTEVTTVSPDDRPLVLVALSSTFQDHAACLQRIVDGLAKLPVRAIVTTGPALEPGAIAAPSNVDVVAAAPHAAILRHAAAVVTHGGHGTVVRSLAAGVPLVVLPHGRDQADNARRVSARGAGITLRRSASSATIAAAVERVLADPSFAAAAGRLGATICRDAASGALVEQLEALPETAGSASTSRSSDEAERDHR